MIEQCAPSSITLLPTELALYYIHLPLQEKVLLDGPWNEIPALYLANKILCFEIMPDPPANIQTLIVLLAWVTPCDAAQF